MKTFATRHPAVVFFGLAYALSWWPSLFTRGGLFPFGPLLAAVIVTALTGGRAGLRRWWQAIRRWRGGARWYAIAVALPVGMNVSAALLAVRLGAPRPTAEQVGAWPHLFLVFVFYLVALGPLGEEPGWRGFAFPRLEQVFGNRTVASLILGLAIALWHLPLVTGGQQRPLILLAIVAAQIIYTWLASQVDAPVLIVMLAHAAQGGLAGEYFGPMFTGDAATLETRLLVAIHCAVAAAIVIATRATLAPRPTRASVVR